MLNYFFLFRYCVYYIGTTSLLSWALGLAPAKDNFWSSEWQPGSAYKNTTHEPYSEMQVQTYFPLLLPCLEFWHFFHFMLLVLKYRRDRNYSESGTCV